MASRLTTLIVVSIVAATLIAGIITRAQREEQGPVDVMVLNGKVYGGDAKTFAEAVAVRGNRIVAVGSNREVKRLRRPQTTVIDAHGGSVLPGFNDANAHFLEGGLGLTDVNLEGADTPEELAERLRTHAGAHPDAPWVLGRGWNPSACVSHVRACKELEAVVPDRPVFLTSLDGRAAWASAAALKLARVTRAIRSPRAGVIVRDAKGEPTGELKDSAVNLVRAAVPAPDREDRLAALRAGIQEAHRLGVTSVQTAGTPDDISLWDELRAVDELTIRAYHAMTASPHATAGDIDKLEGVRRQHGDDPLLKTGAIEIAEDTTDPAAGSGRALPPKNGVTTDGTRQLVALLDRRGWQVWVRASSARGMRLALDVFQAASDANPVPARGRRHRIEYGASIGSADLERFTRLGVIASVQPAPAAGSNPSVAPVSPAAGDAAPRWSWINLAGVQGRLAFGSNWPASSLDPRAGLREVAAENPAELEEAPSLSPAAVQPVTTLPLAAAIDAYTSGAAYASFDEQRKGTLAPGKLADIVILSADVFAAPAQHLLDAQVVVTIFDGKVVYRRAEN